MVNFIQKNAAKIVIIAGAALISSIGGGCKCDPQNSTKSQKCIDASKTHGAECAKNSSGKVATTNKNLRCKTDTCDAKDFNSKDGACCEKKGICSDVFQLSTGTAKDKEKCGTDKVLSTQYKCHGDCDKKNDKEQCCVDKPAVATPACTKASDDAACKVKECNIAEQFRVLGANGGCTNKCAKQDGTTIEESECACATADEDDVTKVATCRVGETCKATKKGTLGVCALPTCAATNKAGYASNCLYDAGKKTCGKDGWFNGSTCIYKTCTADTVSEDSEYCACTQSDYKVKLGDTSAKKEEVLKFCTRGQTCSFSNKVPSCTAVTTDCDASVNQNCRYKLKDSDNNYQFCLGDYYWSNDAKMCGLACPDQDGNAQGKTNANACMCLAQTGQTSVDLCSKDKLFCKRAEATGSKCKDAFHGR